MLYREEDFTTDAIFDHFHVAEDSLIRKSGQIHATHFVLRKSPQSVALVGVAFLTSIDRAYLSLQVNEWYETAMSNPKLFSNDDNNLMKQKHSNFFGARNDQSIFSVLSKLPRYKDSVLLLPDCYQCGPFQDLRCLSFVLMMGCSACFSSRLKAKAS
jgi:hypothetical protein